LPSGALPAGVVDAVIERLFARDPQAALALLVQWIDAVSRDEVVDEHWLAERLKRLSTPPLT
jgi:hypothetical protein